jgi:hypothetical protein
MPHSDYGGHFRQATLQAQMLVECLRLEYNRIENLAWAGQSRRPARAGVLAARTEMSAGSDDREKIRDALEMTDLETITGRITFDKDHNLIKPAAILEIENGRQVFKGWVKP